MITQNDQDWALCVKNYIASFERVIYMLNNYVAVLDDFEKHNLEGLKFELDKRIRTIVREIGK